MLTTTITTTTSQSHTTTITSHIIRQKLNLNFLEANIYIFVLNFVGNNGSIEMEGLDALIEA